MTSGKNIFSCESFSFDCEVHNIKKQNQNLKRSSSFDAQNQFHLTYDEVSIMTSCKWPRNEERIRKAVRRS